MAQENIGKRFEGYQIYDQQYEKVGKVDDLFVDENDVPEYRQAARRPGPR